MQYNQLASYLYCKWQYEYVNKERGCGCDTILADMGKDMASEQDPSTLVKITRSVEYFPEVIISLNIRAADELQREYFPMQAELPVSTVAEIFHPPSV